MARSLMSSSRCSSRNFTSFAYGPVDGFLGGAAATALAGTGAAFAGAFAGAFAVALVGAGAALALAFVAAGAFAGAFAGALVALAGAFAGAFVALFAVALVVTAFFTASFLTDGLAAGLADAPLLRAGGRPAAAALPLPAAAAGLVDADVADRAAFLVGVMSSLLSSGGYEDATGGGSGRPGGGDHTGRPRSRQSRAGDAPAGLAGLGLAAVEVDDRLRTAVAGRRAGPGGRSALVAAATRSESHERI